MSETIKLPEDWRFSHKWQGVVMKVKIQKIKMILPFGTDKTFFFPIQPITCSFIHWLCLSIHLSCHPHPTVTSLGLHLHCSHHKQNQWPPATIAEDWSSPARGHKQLQPTGDVLLQQNQKMFLKQCGVGGFFTFPTSPPVHLLNILSPHSDTPFMHVSNKLRRQPEGIQDSYI